MKIFLPLHYRRGSDILSIIIPRLLLVCDDVQPSVIGKLVSMKQDRLYYGECISKGVTALSRTLQERDLSLLTLAQGRTCEVLRC